MTDTSLAESPTPPAAPTAAVVEALPPLPVGAIEIKAKPKTPGNVRLVGVDYKALPMKSLVLLGWQEKIDAAGKDNEKILVVLEAWMASIFGRNTAPKIMARLKEADDDLDLPDILELIKAMAEKATKNPTT